MKGLVIVGLLLAAAATAHADEWYVNYQKAKEAVQARQWQRAVDLLNEAVGDKDQSSAHVKTYGMQFIPYFPYIYRGAAYFNLNNKVAAKADLEREENTEASGDDKSLLQQYLDMLRKAAAPQVPPAIAEQKKPEPEQTNPQKEQKEQKESKQPEKRQPETKPGRPTPAASESSTKPSRQDVQQAPRESARPPSTPATAILTDTVGQGWLTAARASLDGGNYRQAKSRVLEYRRGGGTSDEATRLLSAIGTIEEQVRRGVTYYFEGKFGEAATELAGASSRGRDNPHMFAVLACSYAAQYLLGGSSDSALKRKAAEAYARARSLDGGYMLNKDYISPQIIDLLAAQ
jgi:hypothetical protein